MLSQFTLSLSKGSIAVVSHSSFSIIHLVFVIPPFALMQKVEPKIKASPNRSARLAAHAQQQSLLHSSFFYFVPSSLFLYYLQLFQKAMPFL
jgi:hypothetical protein